MSNSKASLLQYEALCAIPLVSPFTASIENSLCRMSMRCMKCQRLKSSVTTLSNTSLNFVAAFCSVTSSMEEQNALYCSSLNNSAGTLNRKYWRKYRGWKNVVHSQDSLCFGRTVKICSRTHPKKGTVLPIMKRRAVSLAVPLSSACRKNHRESFCPPRNQGGEVVYPKSQTPSQRCRNTLQIS